MVDELGRLAVNLVTMGDFEGPLKVCFSRFNITAKLRYSRYRRL